MNIRKILISVAVFFLSTSASFAQSYKVIKSNGNRATFELSKDTTVKVGDVLELSPEDVEARSNEPDGSRNFKVAVTATSSLSLEDDGGYTNSTGVGFGRNLGKWEITPAIALSRLTNNGESEFGFSFAVGAEYNFIANKPGTNFVPSFVIIGNFGKAAGVKLLTFNAGLKSKLYLIPKTQTSISLGFLFGMAKAFVAGESSSWVKSVSIPTVGLETYF